MPPRPAALDPDHLAIAALGFLAGEPERLTRFLDLTGIDPHDVREVAREPQFLASVLDHLLGNESLLIAFAAELGIAPERVGAARRQFGGDAFE